MILARSFVAKSIQNQKKRLPFLPGRSCLFSSGGSGPSMNQKFDEILSFHNGVAAVRDSTNGGAYHIDQNGAPMYDSRFQRTFGFYEQRAAVMDFNGSFFHIDLTGRPVYSDRYSWCGNFHGVPEEGVFRSTVRDSDNRYFYIDHQGEQILGPFLYAGDPNSAGHSVVHDFDGNPTIIDVNGRDWSTGASMIERNLIEACVPHKGIALVRDGAGWFYMNQEGQELGGCERYLFAEPHYNGQARVRFLNGQWGVVDETGKVVVHLGESMLSSAVELENISKRYWESLSLKKILESNALQQELSEMSPSSTNATFREILKDCSIEMGLLRRGLPSEEAINSTSQLLNRGILLTASSRARGTGDVSNITEERCRYWLQDRYLKAWMDCPSETRNRDTFADLGADPASVERSQHVLKSYADTDWKGAGAVVSKLLHGQSQGFKQPPDVDVRTIVDMGGGYGSLLRELQGCGLLSNTEKFICIDRPEVVAAAVSSSARANSDTQQSINNTELNANIVNYKDGDLFGGPLEKADLYLMSRVLHDWSDDQATAILDRLHSMSPKHARLCVIDRVCTPDKPHALLSLHMFALQGSHERNHEQWQGLFSSAGWQIDGREHFNGHEMYLLTKKTQLPPAAVLEDAYGSTAGRSFHSVADTYTSHPVEELTAMPTVRKAVITAGGLGTRIAPQSVVTPKALLPIISPSWEVRPALSYVLDQFCDISHAVDQVYVVSTPQWIPLLETFLQDYHRRQHATTPTTTTGRKELAVDIITQDSAGGFGDAVLAAKQAIDDEPFVLAVGDHVFSVDCVKNVLSAYKEVPLNSCFRDWRKTALTGAMLCSDSEVQHTGLLRNQESAYQPGIPWLVHQMVEKPTSNYGSFQPSEGDLGKYPSQLGIDVLPPSIFTLLQTEKDRIGPQEEVDLRKVLRESLQSDRCLFGALIDGHRLDIGNPRAYYSSFQVVPNDVHGVYHVPIQATAEVWDFQEQDEILQSIRALRLENSVHIPATLRHALFSRAGEIHISSSPGRMDLMCGFADYSGSYAIQQPTAERVVSLATFEENTNFQSNKGNQGMIRLACIQVDKLSELSRAITTGDFKVRETSFPTRELFAAAGQFKSETDLRATLSVKRTADDAPSLWEQYLTGMLHRVYQQYSAKTNFPEGNDFTVVTVSDLPWNAGLASSAAVEVATAIALGKALQLPDNFFEPVSLSMLCKEVENRVVGAPCGILDQLTVTHPCARTNMHPLVGIQCRMPPLDQPTYSLPLPEGLAVIALESGVKRSTVSTAYQAVRTSTNVGKAILEASVGEEIQYLCDLTPSQFATFEDQVPKTMTGGEIQAQFPDLSTHDNFCDKDSSVTYPVRAATRFPIEENHRVQVIQDVLQSLDKNAIPRESGLRVMGELMAQTNVGYGKCGLNTNATSILVDEMRNSGAIGAKISGGGGGGAVVSLVNESFLKNPSSFEQVQERYLAKTGLPCTLRRGTSGPAKYHGALRRHFSTSRTTTFHDPPKPRVLVVNHGYPPDFNGGSEVYAQMVALQLKNSGQCESVHVFAREHDPFRPDFEIRKTVDQLDSDLPVFRMNYSREAPYFRFMAEEVDRSFQEVVQEVKPDIVHLHHMNHLSLNLPAVAKAAGAKVLYTLHDYWLMCPRGQFLQTGAARNDPWKLCDGQENSKCAERCYASRYAGGVYDTCAGQTKDDEHQYWTSWIASRMDATRNACEHVDAFIAPSQYLRNKFVNDFSLPADKVIVEPYGFFRDRLANRKRRHETFVDSSAQVSENENPFVFAYAGRHQPGKGINLLVEAALKVLQDTTKSSNDSCGNEDISFRVKIFGRQEANSSRALQRMIEESPHPRAGDIFSWEAEYVNKDIVNNVFNEVDCLVVPSIWEENSPLVIHEAQQCGVPVITSSSGGMGELVKDSVNGLSFEHRNANSLAEAMQKAVDQPKGMRYLGQRGYLYSSDGQIPCIEQHTETLLRLFHTMRSEDSQRSIAETASNSWYTTAHAKINPTDAAAESLAEAPLDHTQSKQHAIEHLPAPWRVTFDTNPDDCNFSCTMCEQHSDFSPHKKKRKEQCIRKRRMDFEIIRETVAELAPKGLKEIIPTTMGEPLYYKHFPEILQLCHEHGVKLNLTTNGSFYKRGAERWAEEIVPVGSDVKISWNGITQETQEKIMKGSNLVTQIKNLRKFVEIRNKIAKKGGNYCSVTLQLTFMEVNLEEIPELVKFAIKEDCDRVKGHHLWAHFAEIKDENLRRNKESIRRWNAIASQCREIVSTHVRPSGRPFRLENFSHLGESQGSQGGVDPRTVCPFLGREAWVNHSGRFDPCCAPDEQRKSLGSFGNITDPETRLLDIWKSDQYNNLVQNYTKRDLCKNCNMRRPKEA